MYNQVIKLVSVTESVNEYGDLVPERSEREVFADVRSVGMNEFYQANVSGLKAEIKFVLADYLEWNGETIILFADYGKPELEYSLIRSYRSGNELELVCKRGVDDANA